MAIATSIDALAVGVSISCLGISIINPALIIGGITFVTSFAGVYIGDHAGHYFEKKLEIFGGVVLIGIGIKILVEHLFMS
jgi:putative Mn2+ efflux pump MntP